MSELETSPTGQGGHALLNDQMSSAVSSAAKIHAPGRGGAQGGAAAQKNTGVKEGPKWPIQGFIDYDPTAVNFFQCSCTDQQKNKKGCPVCEA